MKVIEAVKVIPLVRLILMNHPNANEICENMQKIIDRHTFEAEPKRFARWIYIGQDRMGHDIYGCSACDKCDDGNKQYLNFCNNCGAKMKWED